MHREDEPRKNCTSCLFDNPGRSTLWDNSNQPHDNSNWSSGGKKKGIGKMSLGTILRQVVATIPGGRRGGTLPTGRTIISSGHGGTNKIGHGGTIAIGGARPNGTMTTTTGAVITNVRKSRSSLIEWLFVLFQRG